MTITRIDPNPQFAQATVHGGFVFIAGQIADDWDKDIVGQSEEIFAKIDAILAAATSDKSRLLSLTVFIKDFADYAAYKAAYVGWLDAETMPARATVAAEMLDPKILIEIQGVAAV
ncbi:MAG: RidA family protein [Hyphomicrobiales bacterium]|nr:RidA family protein [Hyphomicrobiales bacterium]